MSLMYYPAQILPLNLKLERLPISAFERFPSVTRRTEICEKYVISAVSQIGLNVEVILSAPEQPNISVHYHYDQVVYVQPE